MSQPKLLFYCQHLLGVGHVTRSLAIASALVDKFDVYFLQGGPDIHRSLTHQNFHHIFIDPLLMRESDSSLYDPEGRREVAEIFSARAEKISSLIAKFGFDVVVTELFPFGRNKFRREVLAMINQLQARNPSALVAASVRDILVAREPGFEDKVVGIVKNHYDLVLVHSDEKILRFEETFLRTPDIADKIRYSGFVAETHVDSADSSLAKWTSACAANQRRGVLVSQGGGSVGEELMLAAAKAARLMPDTPFQFVLGPYSPPDLRQKLEAILQASPALGLARVRDFLPNFEEELSKAALSISLAGYNTMMNALNTKTMSLIYPYTANEEQSLRGLRFQEIGALKILGEADLEPSHLVPLIKTHLNGFPEKSSVNLLGAKHSCEILHSLWRTKTEKRKLQ